MPSRVTTAWSEILAALGPTGTRAVRPPATPKALAALARQLGGPVPRDLAASLALHDGTRAETALWSNERLLGAAGIARRARMMRALVQRGDLPPVHWNPAWIPLTDADGDGFCLEGARVVYFKNSGGRARVAAPSFGAWLATLPRQILAEARADRRRARATADPASAQLPQRERVRLARLDAELPYLVAFVVEAPRWSRGPLTRARVLTFHPIARVRAADVLARALTRGVVTERRGVISVTATGRKLRL